MRRSGTVSVLILALWGLFPCSQVAASERWMATGPFTSQPIGHHDFCRRHAEECRQITISGQPVRMSEALWQRMAEVNDAFNTAILPRTDLELWNRPEYWSYPIDQGDCEDFVLAKRQTLIESGVPAGSLSITVVRQTNGDGHAVLTVRTSAGDFILDNLDPKIRRWYDTDYQFVKRQSNRHSGLWVHIEDSREVAVGSVRP